MQAYIVFGCNAYLSDIVNILENCNDHGYIKTIIINQIEQKKEGTPSWNEIVAQINQYYTKIHKLKQTNQQELKHFIPSEDEQYLICFTGEKAYWLAKQLQHKYAIKFKTIIHKTTTIAHDCQISEGVTINASCTIAPNVTIGAFTRINRGVLVGHGTIIGSGVNIQPGANIAGLTKVGPGATINMGAIIADRVKIGANSIVAAGAVVLDDVPPNVLVAGVPAIVKRQLKG